MSRPAIIWSPEYEIQIGRHVFPTQKFRLLRDALVGRGSIIPEEIETPAPATDAELLTVLAPEYLAEMRVYTHGPRTIRSELPITRNIIEGVVHTAGGSILCARRALQTGAACHLGGGFHHGYPDHAEGFCYINDVAIAAEVVRRENPGLRIAIIDTDVHQGNGTAACFRDQPDVYTFSIHQEELYPRPKETGDLDIGLPKGPSASLYLSELQRGLEESLDGHRPGLAIHVAGVDPYEDDQLGGLRLSWETMGERDRLVAHACAARGIPLMTVVAGGYARQLADTVGLHVQTVEIMQQVFGSWK